MSSKPEFVCRSQQLSIFFLFFASLVIFSFLTIFSTYKHALVPNEVSAISPGVKIGSKRAQWLDIVAEKLDKRRMKLGLVNTEAASMFEVSELETFEIKFDKVRGDLKWEELYPVWIDEEVKYAKPPSCPEIPMAELEESHYRNVDVLVARSPCGIRDVFRLQVNLVAADLVLRYSELQANGQAMLVVFVGQCEPMLEIFICDDLLSKGDNFWIYRPNLKKLKQKLEMPFGSCQLAPLRQDDGDAASTTIQTPREAYVTVLHSSEGYVCGAIALAQSIKQTNSTKDLVLLADDFISLHSMRGLRAAGWKKIKVIKRIRSHHAVKDAYNEWNYSKLRVWQLTEYDKVMFIDSDIMVVRNVDHFFQHPQLSAAGNDGLLFNSGVMLIEPSECMFQTLMRKSVEIVSYNGGDQGFLNEVFTWWHRWPRKINTFKFFDRNVAQDRRVVSDDSYAIHYFGLKPWVCYRDYDCNWDMENYHSYASDFVHKRWWKVYDKMPKGLQSYCGLTKTMDERIKKYRKLAKQVHLADGHWRVKVKDPRQHTYCRSGSTK